MAEEAVTGTSAAPPVRSRWHELRLVWAAMGADIDRVYADAGIGGLSRNYVKELIRLHARGPMTISELAGSLGRPLFAFIRKVADMEAAGWVTTTVSASADDRDKMVAVTAKTERIADQLIAEWEATEAVIAEIEAEIPYPISRAAADLEKVLERKSFHDRIVDNLAENDNWSS